MKTIFHVNGASRNYGDQALVLSMQTEFLKLSDEPIQFLNLDVKINNPITGCMVDMINEFGDMVIVGGGGMIMEGDGYETLSGWQFNISVEDLRRLRVPLVIYAVGYNAFPSDEHTESPETLEHLVETQRASELFSVRDKGSDRHLQHLGLQPSVVIPDPAMFCPHYDVALPDLEDYDYLIGLNWAGDRSDKRFDKYYEYDTIKNVSEILENIVEKYNGKIIYIPHVSCYDLEAGNYFREYLGEYFYDISEHFPFLYPEHIAGVPVLSGLYRQLDLAIGMRGHSNIIPYGQGTPFIGFGQHGKTKFFADETESITVRNDCVGLHDNIEFLLENVESRVIIEKNLQKFRSQFDEFNSKVIELL